MYTTDRTLKAVSFSPWKYCNLHSITFFIAFIQSLFNIINYSVLTFLTFWSPQIDDLETLEAVREDDLHRAGLKMGDNKNPPRASSKIERKSPEQLTIELIRDGVGGHNSRLKEVSHAKCECTFNNDLYFPA